MLKLNHVALTVSNRERSAEFYSRFFGLTERVHDDEHLLILRSPDGSILALSEGDSPHAQPRTTHFGFEAESPSAVKTMRASFREAGVEEAEWQASGPTRVQVLDPDGYRVEVYAWN
jgi:catechol 2,3-dioxygenase-like lactoylglutathione lyase family enzyme